MGFAKDIGIQNIIVDTDGYVEDLIPLYIVCGITGMYSFERAAYNDLLRIGKEFPDLLMIGVSIKEFYLKIQMKKGSTKNCIW